VSGRPESKIDSGLKPRRAVPRTTAKKRPAAETLAMKQASDHALSNASPP
jgi:hypothetical protein